MQVSQTELGLCVYRLLLDVCWGCVYRLLLDVCWGCVSTDYSLMCAGAVCLQSTP